VIREHAFNSAWWGKPAGIVDDAAFFSASDEEQRRALAPYAWAEFRCALETAPDPWTLARRGFAQADTQLRFRIPLKRPPARPASSATLPVRFADEAPFVLRAEDLPFFDHERFRWLPDASRDSVRRRYALWANDLQTKSPAWCVQVGTPADPQGWFLSEPEKDHLHLALAMLRPGATISGFDLYAAALAAFAERGMRLGEARFSIENRAVHNIYARLGAVFLETIGVWMWVAG
jgi:hypothetical protein